MLRELADESDNHHGLTMNMWKTKVMMETDAPIYVRLVRPSCVLLIRKCLIQMWVAAQIPQWSNMWS